MDKKRITTLEDFGDIQLRNLGQDVVSEQAIREAVTLFSNLVPGATQDEIAEAVKNLKTRYFIRMDTGTTGIPALFCLYHDCDHPHPAVDSLYESGQGFREKEK